MRFDWSQYLALARQLAREKSNACDDESRQRSAISRAYYGAFVSARNHLRDKERRQDLDNDPHRRVREAFLLSSAKERRRIGNQLNQLRISRQKADYEDTFPGLVWEMNRSLRQAQEIIEGLANL